MSVTTIPLTWWIGRTHIILWSSEILCHSAMLIASTRRLYWTRTTPFGFPVVPEV